MINRNPFISIFRTMIMMLGETDGLDTFIIPYTNNQLHFGKITLTFFAVFIFLIPILLTNLLVFIIYIDFVKFALIIFDKINRLVWQLVILNQSKKMLSLNEKLCKYNKLLIFFIIRNFKIVII
jgi:hypothetical protein